MVLHRTLRVVVRRQGGERLVKKVSEVGLTQPEEVASRMLLPRKCRGEEEEGEEEEEEEEGEEEEDRVKPVVGSLYANSGTQRK